MNIAGDINVVVFSIVRSTVYCIALIFGGAKILANSQFRHLAEF